jgi:hypothetical protein
VLSTRYIGNLDAYTSRFVHIHTCFILSLYRLLHGYAFDVSDTYSAPKPPNALPIQRFKAISVPLVVRKGH